MSEDDPPQQPTESDPAYGLPSWQSIVDGANGLVPNVGSLGRMVWKNSDNTMSLTHYAKLQVRFCYDGPIDEFSDALCEALGDCSAGLLIECVSEGKLPPILLSLASLYTEDVYNFYHGIGWRPVSVETCEG